MTGHQELRGEFLQRYCKLNSMSATPANSPRKSQTATPIDFEKKRTKAGIHKSPGIPTPDLSDISAARSPADVHLKSPKRGVVSPRKRQPDIANKRNIWTVIVSFWHTLVERLWAEEGEAKKTKQHHGMKKKIAIGIAVLIFLLCLGVILDE